MEMDSGCFSLLCVLQSSATKWKQAPELSPSRGPPGCTQSEESRSCGASRRERKCYDAEGWNDGRWIAVSWSSRTLTGLLKRRLKTSFYQKQSSSSVLRLTIMFSRAHFASQQLRNTGMKMFRIEGQNICGEWGFFSSCWDQYTFKLLAWSCKVLKSNTDIKSTYVWI